jgi:membrane dipeptidase
MSKVSPMSEPRPLPPSADAALRHAHALLARHPLVDGHNDLPWVVRQAGRSDLAAYDLTRRHPETDTDIPRLIEGRVATQVFAAYLPTRISNPATVTLEQIDLILRMEERHADVFHPVRQPSDIAAAFAGGRIGSLISVEGTVGLECSLAPLRLWHRLGVRLVTLCHNETLPWVDSATDARGGVHDGLSEFGRAMVGEMNRLGLIADLAHVAPHAMHKVLDTTAAPVVISHSNAAALCDHPRNTPDDVLARIPGNGGLVMATFVPEFLNRTSWRAIRAYKDAFGKTRSGLAPAELDAARRLSIDGWDRDGIAFLCDHLAHLRERVGDDHLGIGSDFYGGPNPPGLEDASTFPALIAELVRRGWSDDALIKLIGGNFVRVWGQILNQASAHARPAAAA